MKNNAKYVVVSPAKDESQYIESTLKSVVAQTILPVRWIIVDDGSSDNTAEIVRRYSQQHRWIQLLQLPRRNVRNPGPAGVYAFVAALEALGQVEYDFLVKLDSDLELPLNYFEIALKRFEDDPRLGIASGTYLENWDETWEPIVMPEYHAAGASKIMRRKCFEDFGGFAPTLGWDTIDEIRAQMKGWKTCHFQDIQFKHLRHEGEGTGILKTCKDNGEIYYLLGGGFGFFLLKILHRSLSWKKPYALKSMAMLSGYLHPLLKGIPRIVTKEEAFHYRTLLNSRISSTLKQKLLRSSTPQQNLGH
jgi:poly-beta-1,6-N-acetyl-D-glucosamine synthase